MISKTRILAGAAPLLLGLTLIGVEMGASQAGSSGEGPLRCEIQTTSANGMVALEGVVHADVAVSGSYSFRISSSGGSGRSNIQQGGGFTAGPGGPVTLGRVMLGANGAYDASLTVTSNGSTVACSERVGGAI